MKGLYLECNSGISGDMSVAALIDAGADVKVLEEVLASIPLEGFKTEITRVNKNGIDVCDFNVILETENHDHDMEYLFGHEHHHEHHHDHEQEEHHHVHQEEHHHEHSHDHEHHHHEHEHEHHHHHEHRGLPEIQEIIAKTKMTENARKLALKIFQILAEAESKAHNRPLNEVHFHEVGAVDSIVDIISIAVCFDNLNVDEVIVTKLCEGTGTVRCQHGILPVPVPAVSNIVSAYDLPLSIMNEHGEFITPTGAAFVASVMTSSKLPENFKIKKIGMGAGKRKYERPSIVRAFVIEYDKEDEEVVYKLETNIDDCSGEALGFVMEELFAAGAYDVHYVPCFMKKSRPAYLLNVICSEEKIPVMENIIFMNTTTIGIRRVKVDRTVLDREILEMDSEFGPVKVKRVKLPDGTTRDYPEYESIAKICRESKQNYMDVYSKLLKL